jgi:hypothetical protein
VRTSLAQLRSNIPPRSDRYWPLRKTSKQAWTWPTSTNTESSDCEIRDHQKLGARECGGGVIVGVGATRQLLEAYESGSGTEVVTTYRMQTDAESNRWPSPACRAAVMSVWRVSLHRCGDTPGRASTVRPVFVVESHKCNF